MDIQLPLQESLTETGEPTGIELEREPSPPPVEIRDPFDPEKIDVITRTMTVDLLLSRLRAGAIDLQPDFQRRPGIWTERRQAMLIESMLLRIPLPALYAAEDKDEQWAIVDGIQRLTAIARFVEPDAVAASRLRLAGLEYLSDLEGMTFDGLPPKLQRRINETQLVVHVIRHETPEPAKFNVFARINTGGLPLSPQELRHALVAGPARQILKDWAESDPFRSATDNSIRDERMADRELVLRFIAYRLTPYSQYNTYDFDDFLRRTMRALNDLSADRLAALRAEFNSAMEAASAIFGSDAFRKRHAKGDGRYPINKALFEAVAVNLSTIDAPTRRLLVERREGVKDAFIALMNERAFAEAVSQGTADISKVKLRFGRIEQLFREVSEREEVL